MSPATRLENAARAAIQEFERLEYLLRPRYEGKLAMPDRAVIRRLQRALVTPPPTRRPAPRRYVVAIDVPGYPASLTCRPRYVAARDTGRPTDLDHLPPTIGYLETITAPTARAAIAAYRPAHPLPAWQRPVRGARP